MRLSWMTPRSGAMVLRKSGSTGTRRTTQRSSLESSILRRLMSQSGGGGESSSCNNPAKESLPCCTTFRGSERSLEKYISSPRSEEHTSELQSPDHLVCRLLLEKKKYRTRISV